jgi:hypothetical protein
VLFAQANAPPSGKRSEQNANIEADEFQLFTGKEVALQDSYLTGCYKSTKAV